MTDSSKPSSFFGRPGVPAFAALVLAVVTAGIYAGSLDVPFLFDDAPAIERNESIRHLSTALLPPQTAAGAAGRPIVNLSLAINYALGGLNPRGYHAVNVGLHVLVGLVLFGLVRRTLMLPKLQSRFGRSAVPFAFGTAGLWMVHPVLTESVVCVVQRNEVLVSLFYLLTLYCFVRSVASSSPLRWRVLAVTSCALGMATKEVMVTAPLIVLLFDRTFVAEEFRKACRARWGFYAALGTTWLILAVLVQQHGQRAGTVGFGLGVTSWTYLLTQCEALLTYLKLSVWPYPLVLDYGVDIVSGAAEVWWQGLVILGLLVTTVIVLCRRPILGFLAAWFFVILAPSSSFIPLTTQPIAEHRLYLPLVAIVALVVLALKELGIRRATTLVLAGIVAMGSLTIARVRDYRTEETIWKDTLARKPKNARAHASLANALAREERWNDALVEYEHAIRLRPDYADAQSDYATILLKMNRATDAVPHFEAALRLKPDDNQIEFNLAVGLAQVGRRKEAIARLEDLLSRDPRMVAAWNNLGDAFIKEDQLANAAQAFQKALEVQPQFAAAQHNLGLVLTWLGRPAEAVVHFEEALKQLPESAAVHHNLAVALDLTGRRAEALVHEAEALRLQPHFPAARESYERMGGK